MTTAIATKPATHVPLGHLVDGRHLRELAYIDGHWTALSH
jgi:hypothetical protein